eukprot:3459401-Pyramimonas_sp.AAC.1
MRVRPECDTGDLYKEKTGWMRSSAWVGCHTRASLAGPRPPPPAAGSPTAPAGQNWKVSLALRDRQILNPDCILQLAAEGCATFRREVHPRAFLKGSIHPVEGSIRPAEGSIHPVEGSFRPAEGSIRSATVSIHPAKGSIHPATVSIYPVEKLIQPAKGSIRLAE